MNNERYPSGIFIIEMSELMADGSQGPWGPVWPTKQASGLRAYDNLTTAKRALSAIPKRFTGKLRVINIPVIGEPATLVTKDIAIPEQ